MEFKVYRATNTFNNMSYIGSTKRALRDRINSHYTLARYTQKRSKKMSKFLSALLEVQKIFFTWEILEYAATREDVVELENYYMDKFDTINNGYNTAKAYVCNNGVNRKDVQDKRIFEFINTETNEQFTGTQSELITKYNLFQPAINILCNSNTKRSYKKWTIIGKQRKQNEKCKTNQTLHLFNLDTLEEFNGTPIEFDKKYKVNIETLIYRRSYTAHNWCLYEDKDNFIKCNKLFISKNKKNKSFLP